MKKAAILAAGEGTRLREVSRYKPIVKIYGSTLFELTYKNLQFQNFKQVIIIFNDDERKMNLVQLPSLNDKNVNYFFKSTLSSMHSLHEVSIKLDLQEKEHFFVSMVDSIIKATDAKNFHVFCQSLEDDESAIIATSYIEDENPLTLKTDNLGYVTEFQCSIGDDTYVTSGIYYFSEKIRPILLEMINSGQTKMRNFLTELVKRKHKIKVFQVIKTLDIDRPQDIKDAEDFLQEQML